MRYNGPRAALAIPLLLMISITLSGGCKAPAAGEDAFVINAERTLNTSHAALKAFLKVADENRPIIRQLPAVDKFAEKLREHVEFDALGVPVPKEEGEPLEVALTKRGFGLIVTYKETKAAGTKAEIQDVLGQIESYAAKAQAALNQIEQRRSAASRPS